MTAVEFYVDPSCPWAWITSRWLEEVAPQRGLQVTWRSYSLHFRDDGGAATTVPEDRRERVIAAHARSHRMLRVFEATRSQAGEAAVGELYHQWGVRVFGDPKGAAANENLLADCLAAAHLDPALGQAADDATWDSPIREAMEVAYAFGGPKTQTPTIVVRDVPPHGFKGPVMAPAPTGEAALRLWDAINVLSSEAGFFEITRPRANPPTWG
jgi:2-hydroxychromene-2-carboxylate isomerase